MKRWKFFLGVFFLSAPTFALTQDQITTEIRLRVKDTHATLRRYSDGQIQNLELEAMRDINTATWAVVKSSAFPLVANTTYYTLPSDYITSVRATKDNLGLPETTVNQQDAKASGWELSKGTPAFYFINPIQPEKIGFTPYPSTSSGTVNLYYVAQSSFSAASTGEPYNGIDALQPYADLIVLYSAYRLYLVEGDINRATLYRQEYEAGIQNMRSRAGSKPNYQPSFSGTRQ